MVSAVIKTHTTVNNRQQTDAGLGPQQATRLRSGRGRVSVGDGGSRHRRGGFLQAKGQLGRSSYHVYLAFIGQSGQLDVRASCLDRFISRQETSSIDQAENDRNKKIKVIRCLCSSFCSNTSGKVRSTLFYPQGEIQLF